MSSPRALSQEAAETGSAGGDYEGELRLANLEQQLRDMQSMLEAERVQHKEERQAMNSKLRMLEAQARTADQQPAPAASGSGRAPNLGAGGERVIHSTPRTADNLFVAVPSSSERPAGGTRRGDSTKATEAQRLAAQRAAARRAAGASQRSVVTSRSSVTGSTARSTRGPVGSAGEGRGVGRTPTASPERHVLTAANRRATALQHAWDKFCVCARDEFTPKELALVSAETLQSLMDHYKVRSSVERAQIEGQWALLQEGKETVGETATPKPSKTAKRPAVKRADHPVPFDLGGDLGKPHLSRRNELGGEGVKPSNPNESTSGSKLVRSHSATLLLRPREAGQCNPNETQSRSTTPRICFRRCESPGPGKDTPRGMKHVGPKESGEFTPRGIKSHGSTRMGGDGARANGIRTGLSGAREGATPRRGVRTYEPHNSPVRTRKPAIHVATPPHLERSHLLTETLGREIGRTRTPRRLESREARTPFALGDN